MAEQSFACPHCGQIVQCDERWAGQQLPCPGCRGTMTIPELQQIEPPPAPAPQAPRRSVPAGQPKFAGKKMAIIGACVIAGGVGFYFLLGWADSLQKKFNDHQHDIAANSSGGEMTHIANLYVMLDKTDPEKMGYMRPMNRGARETAEMGMEKDAPPPNPAEKLPVLPVDWTLDIASATIPDGKVNGNISGTNFVINAARIDASGATRILTLSQGNNLSDPAFFIYLNLNAGETVLNRSWSISKETKGKGVPQIVKRWQPNVRFAPVQKTFTSGYAMKLKMDAPVNGYIPGKIFLSLPDSDKTVMAGLFYIESGEDQ